jgi:hypothetical protein
MQALIIRARDLGLISRKTTSRLFMLMSSLAYRTAEPVQIAHEEPVLAQRIKRLHSDVHGYSVDEVAAITTIPEDEFRNHHISRYPTLRAATPTRRRSAPATSSARI